MRTPLLGAALLLASASAVAADGDRHVSCNLHSDYDFSLTDKSVILTRSSGAPKTVLMRQGRLFVDGRWVQVSDADGARVAEYERVARATMPLARQIGRDAADIAFTALGEVAKGLGNDTQATEARLGKARAVLDARLARSVSATHFNGEDLGKGIGEAVGEVVPMVVGDIVGGALRAAFSGDSARFERLDNLDSQIDAIVAPRAKALERNADLLCRKMRTLDGIDDALDYRHHGKPLDLLHLEPSQQHRDAH